MLRLVAPRALRNPISWVRSLTATSMMLMTPMAPSASVTMPTAPKNKFMTSKMVPTIFEDWMESHSSQAFSSLGSEHWVRRGEGLIFNNRNGVLVVFSFDRKVRSHHLKRDVAAHIQPRIVAPAEMRRAADHFETDSVQQDKRAQRWTAGA